MIKTVRVGDVVGFRTFSGVIRYGEVVDVVVRGEGGRATRKDEISVRLKPDGRVVMVQRWRIGERYDGKKLKQQGDNG
jgi:ABC-type phosphonate transport system ATPase subunit